MSPEAIAPAEDGSTGRKIPSFVTTLLTLVALVATSAGAIVLLNSAPASSSCPYGVTNSYCNPYGGGGGAPNESVVSTPAGIVGISAPAGTTIFDITGSGVTVPPPVNVLDVPIGVIGFTVSGVKPFDTIQVRLQLPPGVTVNAYYKLQNGVWSDYSANVDFSGDPLVVSLTDNGPGDSDPTLGVISDPGAPVLVDRTSPLITCQAATFELHQPNAQVTAGVTDAGVGVDAGSVSVPVDTSGVGSPLQVAVTAADRAGNSATVSCQYAVLYQFTGFAPPVQNGYTTKVSAGASVPLKWTLADYAGAPAGTAASLVSLTSAPADCASGSPTGSATPGALAGSLSSAHGNFVATWKTLKGWSRTCRVATVTLDDGTTHTALFGFS